MVGPILLIEKQVNKYQTSRASIRCNAGDESRNLEFGMWAIHLVNIVQPDSYLRYLGVAISIFWSPSLYHLLDFVSQFQVLPTIKN